MASELKAPSRQLWDRSSLSMAIQVEQKQRMGYFKGSKHLVCQKRFRHFFFKKKKTFDLVKYMLEMEATGFGLTQRDIMKLSYQLTEKNKFFFRKTFC